jgi:hypothetical protein
MACPCEDAAGDIYTVMRVLKAGAWTIEECLFRSRVRRNAGKRIWTFVLV